MEEKIQQEKAREIEEGQQRTAARLKPKEIPEDNKSQLKPYFSWRFCGSIFGKIY